MFSKKFTAAEKTSVWLDQSCVDHEGTDCHCCHGASVAMVPASPGYPLRSSLYFRRVKGFSSFRRVKQSIAPPMSNVHLSMHELLALSADFIG